MQEYKSAMICLRENRVVYLLMTFKLWAKTTQTYRNILYYYIKIMFHAQQVQTTGGSVYRKTCKDILVTVFGYFEWMGESQQRNKTTVEASSLTRHPPHGLLLHLSAPVSCEQWQNFSNMEIWQTMENRNRPLILPLSISLAEQKLSLAELN